MEDHHRDHLMRYCARSGSAFETDRSFRRPSGIGPACLAVAAAAFLAGVFIAGFFA